MTKIKVVYDRYEYVTRAGDPDDRWDRDSTGATITMRGIKKSTENDYGDITVPFDVDHDKAYWLVWADYNTGDSFGSDDNVIEFVDLFQTEEAATNAASQMQENNSGYSMTYTRDDGTSIQVHNPWAGYFESLNELHVQLVRTV